MFSKGKKTFRRQVRRRNDEDSEDDGSTLPPRNANSSAKASTDNGLSKTDPEVDENKASEEDNDYTTAASRIRQRRNFRSGKSSVLGGTTKNRPANSTDRSTKRAVEASQSIGGFEDDDEDVGGSNFLENGKKQAKSTEKKSKSGILLSFAEDFGAEDEDDDQSAEEIGGGGQKHKKKKRRKPKFRAHGIPMEVAEESTTEAATAGKGLYSLESLRELREMNQQMSMRVPLAGRQAQMDIESDREQSEGQTVEETELLEKAKTETENSGYYDEKVMKQIREHRQTQRLRAERLEDDEETTTSRGIDGNGQVEESREEEEEFISLRKGDNGKLGTSASSTTKILKTLILNPSIGSSTVDAAPGDIDGNESDNEMKEWEIEQIRRGGNVAAKAIERTSANLGGGRGMGGSFRSQRNGDRGRIQSVEEIETALQRAAEALEEEVKTYQRKLNYLETNITQTRETLQKLAAEQETQTTKYNFYTDVREFVSDLCYCLRDKLPMIAEAEETLLSLFASQFEAEQKFLEQDVDDEVEDWQENGVVFALSINEKRKDAAVEDKQVDFAGRDLSLYMAQQRKVRRLNRERRREGLRLQEQQEEDARGSGLTPRGWSHLPPSLQGIASAWREGYSQTMRLKEDNIGGGMEEGKSQSQLRLRQQKILEAVEVIFDDARDEFRELSSITSWFQQWKSKYPEAYRDAYCSLALPDIVAPYVRYELLHWNLLTWRRLSSYSNSDSTFSEKGEEDNTLGVFGRFEWLQLMFHYCEQEVQGDDHEGVLVPTILEKHVLPLYKEYIRRIWNPASIEQSKVLRSVIDELSHVFDLPSKAVDGVAALALDKLESYITRLSIPTPIEGVTMDKLGAVEVCIRQLASSVSFLRAVTVWDGVSGASALTQRVRKMCLSALVNEKQVKALEKLLAIVRSFSYEACWLLVLADITKEISTSLPSAWLAQEGGERARPLGIFVHQLAEHMGQFAAGSQLERDTEGALLQQAGQSVYTASEHLMIGVKLSSGKHSAEIRHLLEAAKNFVKPLIS